MTDPSIVPITAYRDRAANRAKPADFITFEEDRLTAHNPDQAMELATSGKTFYADVSTFQPLVNHDYPYPVFCFRGDNGWETDNHAYANWRVVEPWDHVQVALVYSVFIPGQTNAIFNRLKNTFGSNPHLKLCPMTDMESGAGFAGPGNHSSEANDFLAMLADWTSKDHELGYANGYDWSSNWPDRPSWLKRSTAAYTTTDPGTYAWQYYGALPYASPSGYPRHCAPFGSYVDMNVIHKSISQIAEDFGVVKKVEDMTPEETRKEIQQALSAVLTGSNHGHWTHAAYPGLVGGAAKGVHDRLSRLEKGASQVTTQIRDEIADALGAVLSGSNRGAWTHKAHPYLVPGKSKGIHDQLAQARTAISDLATKVESLIKSNGS